MTLNMRDIYRNSRSTELCENAKPQLYNYHMFHSLVVIYWTDLNSWHAARYNKQTNMKYSSREFFKFG